MANHDDSSISRRKFLEQASAAVGVVALGDACSDGKTEQPNTAAGANAENTSAGTSSTASSAGAGNTASGSAGSSTAGAKAATAGMKAPAAGTSSAAAGSGTSAGNSATANAGSTAAPSGQSGAGAPATPAAGSGAAPSGTPAAGGKITVGIVSRSSIDEMVARAVELAGGLDDIKEGQTVFIKPNAVNDRAIGMTGIRTSPEVLAAVVKLVKQRKPGKITVGDRSARQFPDTDRIFTESGLRDAAMMAGADEVYAAKSPADAPDEWMLLQPPMWEVTWRAAGGLLAMKKILEADHLINVPTCKNHRNAMFSLSMKAFMGGIGDSTRDPIHFSDSIGGNFDAIGRDLAILNQMFHPLMNIIDATTAIINGGPQGDGADAVRVMPGLVFASKDRLAADAAAVSLIQLELDTATVSMPDASQTQLKRNPVWMLPQIVHGKELGIGMGDPNNIALMFDGVMRSADIEAKFRRTS